MPAGVCGPQASCWHKWGTTPLSPGCPAKPAQAMPPRRFAGLADVGWSWTATSPVCPADCFPAAGSLRRRSVPISSAKRSGLASSFSRGGTGGERSELAFGRNQQARLQVRRNAGRFASGSSAAVPQEQTWLTAVAAPG